MRHLFDQRYSVREGIHPDGSPRMVERMRCSRCGVGASWPGAADDCSAPKPVSEESRRAKNAKRYKGGRKPPMPASEAIEARRAKARRWHEKERETLGIEGYRALHAQRMRESRARQKARKEAA
jgi:hypothetical protein